MDYEECSHDCGTYIDKEEQLCGFDWKRCNCCDVVINATRNEFEDE